MKTLCLGVIALAILVSAGARAVAVDNPPTPQLPGIRSMIATSDGTVRDDELAKMIRDAIKASGKTPSSVKVFFNSCYGGGMLDDIANILATDFTPPIPFVGGAASDANQPAWGPDDSWVGNSSMGSFWTDELAKAMANSPPGETVTGTLGTANANDPTAPGGKYAGYLPVDGQPERPQNTTANGGDTVTWGPGIGVVFSGANTDKRHDNNVAKMQGAMMARLGQSFTPSSSTTAGLRGALNAAAQLMPPGGEFVLYVDDHGDVEYDYDEWYRWYTGSKVTLEPTTGWRSRLPSGEISMLHEGWRTGLTLNARQGDMPSPSIKLLADITEPYMIDSFFDVFFNGIPIPEENVPDVLLPGEQAFIPLGPEIWSTIPPGGGPVLLEFLPTGSGGLSVDLLNLELTSGPINDIDLPWVPGDANHDGFVNEIDAQTMAAHWGMLVELGDHSSGDFNADGRVDAADASLLAANWGPHPMVMEAAVPEPSAIVLFVVGVLGLVTARRAFSVRR